MHVTRSRSEIQSRNQLWSKLDGSLPNTDLQTPKLTRCRNPMAPPCLGSQEPKNLSAAPLPCEIFTRWAYIKIPSQSGSLVLSDPRSFDVGRVTLSFLNRSSSRGGG